MRVIRLQVDMHIKPTDEERERFTKNWDLDTPPTEEWLCAEIAFARLDVIPSICAITVTDTGGEA